MLLWDHILTFDREVELIWQLPWNLSTILFLFLRYFVPIGLIMITTGKSANPGVAGRVFNTFYSH